MPAPVVIADELTALGYRLAGAEVHVPQQHAVQRLFAEVRAQAEIVLITADQATFIAPAQLSQALLAERPLLFIIPSARSSASSGDELTHELRAALGVEE